MHPTTRHDLKEKVAAAANELTRELGGVRVISIQGVIKVRVEVWAWPEGDGYRYEAEVTELPWNSIIDGE